tara:strand:+ start:99 stop:347 length:249 start_codon:yes stop_codon:yes gene_type:complete
MKTYIVDIKGVVIDADDWDNTTIHINRNGEWCKIPFDKSDIVETKEDKEDIPIETLEKMARDTDLLLSDNLINFARLVQNKS